jgi:hypothetical protein
MKAFFDHFAAILGALTLILLMMSISHEYGYFMLIGQNFQTLLVTSDYFANAILWLPGVLVFMLGMDWQKLNYNPPEKKRNWKDWKTWRIPTLIGGFFIRDSPDDPELA